ncbi:hypothetical protein J6590_098690, partial [Homalodisca vitripennis]
LKVTSEQPKSPDRRTACKDGIAQRSPIQIATTLNVAITVVPSTLLHLCTMMSW